MLKPHSESGHCARGSFPLHWRLPGEDLDLWERMGQEHQGYGEGGDVLWILGEAKGGTGVGDLKEADAQWATVLRLVANLITFEAFCPLDAPRHPPRTQTHFVFHLPFSHARWQQRSFFELIFHRVIFWEQTFFLCCY